jgi:hypothetical protein
MVNHKNLVGFLTQIFWSPLCVILL